MNRQSNEAVEIIERVSAVSDDVAKATALAEYEECMKNLPPEKELMNEYPFIKE